MSARPIAAPAAAVPAAASRCPVHALAKNGIVVGLVAGALVTLVVFFGLGGWRYYTTPLRVRGYVPVHRLLRPSGAAGQALGAAGALVMSMTALYVARKRWKRLARAGTLRGWLEFHVFCGVFGPVLVSLHTSFKFNGVVSVAYWSMVLVVLSGFVGRVLYARIPRTLRGEELTHAEVVARAAELREALRTTWLPPPLPARIAAFERDAGNPAAGFLQVRLRARRLRRDLAEAGVAAGPGAEAVALALERATLVRRIAVLERTKRLFGLWHVFHLPLVWILFVIFLVHVAVATWLGYTFLSR